MLTVTLLLFSPLALLPILYYNWHHHSPATCIHWRGSDFLAQPSGDLEHIGLTVGAPLPTADLGRGNLVGVAAPRPGCTGCCTKAG